MKLPSINHTFLSLWLILQRFPIAVIAAIAGTIAAMILAVENRAFQKEHYYLFNMILTSSLMLPAFISLQLFIESRQLKSIIYFLSKVVLTVIFVLYYFTLPEELGLPEGMFFGLISIALHLMVAFSPFLEKHSENGFWQFNKVLFIRILTAALYSGVLYLGLILALLAIDNLFGINIDEDIYFQLWIFIMGIFNTLFFLRGIPTDMNMLSSDASYPKGLKLFTQYVLLPLVGIYIIILYAYMIKIGLEWDWPRGWVSYLVIGFSGLGILSFLLLYPLQGMKENKWVSLFLKWFYRSIIPLIFLLGLAVIRRIMEYGITENRYFLIVLTLWLCGITAYFLLSRKKDIRLLPITLAILAVISAFGPWGAMKTAQRSQLARFDNILSYNKLLKDGIIIQPKEDKISFSDQKQLSSILKFLEDRNNLVAIRGYFTVVDDSLMIGNEVYNKSVELAAKMGIRYIYDWETETETQNNYNNFYLYTDSDSLLSISEYDYLVVFNYDNYNDSIAKRYHPFDIFYNKEGNQLEISYEEENIGAIEMDSTLRSWAKKYSEYADRDNISSDDLSVTYQNEHYRFKMYLQYITFEEKDKEMIVQELRTTLVIGEK